MSDETFVGEAATRAPDAAHEVVTVTPNPAIDWTLTVPGLTPGTVNRADTLVVQPGGKGVNVAAALAAWGRPATATGFLGRTNAARFEAFFAACGIADRFIRVDGETRVSVKLLDTGRGETTDINLPGAVPTEAEFAALMDVVDGLSPRWFVLAGSLPPGAPTVFYARLIARLRARGCRVALDTSGDALHAAVEAQPCVVKPNIHELETLVGVRLSTVDSIVDAARTLLEEGVELVVVSMGEEGALFVDADRELLALPPLLTTGSTVGAGDAMVAGVVAGLLAGRGLDGVARIATAFAAATLAGGVGSTTPGEVAAFEAQVELREF